MMKKKKKHIHFIFIKYWNCYATVIVIDPPDPSAALAFITDSCKIHDFINI